MGAKTDALKNIEEQSVDMAVSDFVRPEEEWRKQQALAGCDYAYFVVQFLRGRRRLDIQPDELVATQVFQRSNDAEKQALRLVCDTQQPRDPSPEDSRRLRERDQFIVEVVDGRNLGHADFVAQLRAIPFKVAERQDFDRKMFPTVYASPILFRWLWGR